MFPRKHRHANTDDPTPSRSSAEAASKKSTFSLSKIFSETSTLVDSGTGDPKGPLGLTLLHTPSEPQVDIIFVHGLGGGSRKTWSKTPLLSHYWPQEWLPKDPAFKDVRIHSYGYDSDYLSGKGDSLNIHHMGKSLLGEVSTSPNLSQSRTQIVAVAHSMGGLVVKKAVILAGLDKAHQDLRSRFAAIYFLATPHRGADSARTLKNILRAVHDRAYVTDLEKNSGAIQVINDEFRHFSANLELCSFYETQNMKLFSTLVVDSESAVLGYPEEMQMPMSADHRSICKFESQFDPNYLILRNTLAATVKVCMARPELERQETRSQLGDVRRYLGLSDVFDDDFYTACEARMPGSCQWITAKDDFVDWKDGDTQESGVFWVKGKPAAGKSVLAGYVIEQLRDAGRACSYFFFKHGDKSKSKLGTCLRTLGFQMASANPGIQGAILALQDDGIQVADADYRTLWRVLFLSARFRATLTTQQYWVIDALDECSYPSAFFDLILPRLHESLGLRVFITSRDTAQLGSGFSSLPPALLQSMAISVADTLADIKLFVENKVESLSIVGPEDHGKLAEKIINKSKGSFLWTLLVLKELRSCYSKKEIDHILDDIPTDMERMYQRILDSMSQSVRGKELAKAILVWITCATRTMTISELSGALALDMEDVFPKLNASISSLCGQLVAVDAFEKVQFVHGTVREFLLAGNLASEFAVDETRAHTRMAEGCLKYLIGDELKPPRTNRRRAQPTKRLSFALYAFTAYSYHLSKADPQAKGLFDVVGFFLKSNIVAWIEAIAHSPGPGQLITAARHLKSYYNACCRERSPLHPVLRSLRQWTADLPRIATKFADALKACPSAIFTVIPAFCPSESAIHSIGSQGRKLAVLGAQSEVWDDRISCVDFRQTQPSTLCYGEKMLAIGLSTGTVVLYNATSYQEHKSLNHGEPVKFIRFKNKTDLMATCGMKMTKVWDTRTGEVVHSLSSPPRPLDLQWHDHILLVPSHKSFIAGWNLEQDAEPMPKREWTDSADPGGSPPRRSPCALSISTSHNMLAVAYSGQPITLWDLEEDTYYGSCGKKDSGGITSNHIVVALAFNPNPNIGLMAVAYLDGDLALLDPFTDQQFECFRANCQSLAASPDGRFLAAGGAEGVVDIYEFDTLRLLYRVRSHNSFIKQLCFAADSLHVADIRGSQCSVWEPAVIRGSQCSVWEPAVILRSSLNDDSSGTSAASLVNTVSLESKSNITALVVHQSAKVVFAGRDDGAVLLYCRKTATCLHTLYTHKSPVRLLAWCPLREALLSVDASNRIFMYRIPKSTTPGDWLKAVTLLFQSRLQTDNAIVDVLVSEAAGRFMVSTRESDHMFNFDGSLEAEQMYKNNMDTNRKWISHPKSEAHMLCFKGAVAHMHCWGNWADVGCLSLPTSGTPARLKSLTVFGPGHTRKVLLELSNGESSNKASGLVVLDSLPVLPDRGKDPGSPRSEGFHPAVESSNGKEKQVVAAPSVATALHEAQLTVISGETAHVLAVSDSGKLVFLDYSSWVCSVDLVASGSINAANRGGGAGNGYFRHFFVPYDWFAGRRDIVCAMAEKDLVFARGGDLTVVKGWLEQTEKVEAGSR